MKANQRYLQSAKKMEERYNKKRGVESFSVGDKVSVRIPRIDRTCTDLPRLPCVIVEVLGQAQNVYRLRYVCFISWIFLVANGLSYVHV